MNYCWCTVNVSDLEASIRFYTDFIGLSIESRFSPRPGIEIVFLKDENGVETELIKMPEPLAKAARKGISIGYAVSSLESAMALAGSLGIPIAEGPFETPSVRFFFVEDPDGTRVQVVEK